MSEKWFYEGINEAAISKRDFFRELLSTVWIITATKQPEINATTLPDDFDFMNTDSNIEGDSEGCGSESEGDICSVGDRKGNRNFGTGFCIDARGLILTCNHVTGGYNSIQCENLGNGVRGEAKVLINMPKWDMSLLQLYDLQMPVGVVSRTFDYVKIGDELDEVFCGQNIYAIGNTDSLTGTFMMGIVAYPCAGYNINLLHENKDPITTRASFKDRNQPFRSMGNIAQDVNVRDDEDSLSPNFPIIQISTMAATAGASGCPIFNKRGCVIGMLQGSLPNQNCAVHYSAIKYFIKHVWGGR